MVFQLSCNVPDDYSNVPIMHFERFVVRDDLLMLEPIYFRGQRFTLVHEKKRCYAVDASIRRVVNKACSLYGSSYDAAVALSKKITGGQKKLPICILHKQPLILIPTASSTQHFTKWIVFNYIHTYKSTETNECLVEMNNGQQFSLNFSCHSLRTQMAHAYILERYFENLDDHERHHLIVDDDPFYNVIPIDVLKSINNKTTDFE